MRGKLFELLQVFSRFRCPVVRDQLVEKIIIRQRRPRLDLISRDDLLIKIDRPAVIRDVPVPRDVPLRLLEKPLAFFLLRSEADRFPRETTDLVRVGHKPMMIEMGEEA